MFGATGTLTGEERDEFQTLIGDANRQLGVARRIGILEIFLVLIEIGYSAPDPAAVENTLTSLAPANYSKAIVAGKDNVASEIMLPEGA